MSRIEIFDGWKEKIYWDNTGKLDRLSPNASNSNNVFNVNSNNNPGNVNNNNANNSNGVRPANSLEYYGL